MNILLKTSFLIFLFFTSFLTITLAQPTVEWDKTFGGNKYEALNGAIKTQDEGFLLFGGSSSDKSGEVSEDGFGNSDFWIVRMDSSGNKLWDKRFGGSELDWCFKVLQNTEGYLLIGESNSGIGGNKTTSNQGLSDVWIVQIRPDGSKVWEKRYGGSGRDQPYNAIKTKDNEYYIACHSNSPADGDKTAPNNGDLDIWVLKLDQNGNKVWDKTFGGSGSDDYPTAFSTTQDGNFIIACGSASGFNGDKTTNQQGIKDYWVIKFSPDGQKIWDKSFGGSNTEAPYDIQELMDGSFIIAGNSASQPGGEKSAPNYGETDYWLVKIDSKGNKIWDKTFGGSSYDFAYSIDQNKTGYFLVAGASISPPSGNKEDTLKTDKSYDFWILYLDEEGNKIWEKDIGGNKNDVPFEMVKFKDGAYLVCGGSNSNKSFDKSDDSRNPLIPEADDFWAVKINCISELHIGNDTLVCKLEPVTFDARIPNCRNCLYKWSTGETTPLVTVNPTKTTQYSVKVTFNNACEIKDRVEVFIIPSPDTIAFVVTPPRCHDGKDGIIAVDSIVGGTPPYSLVIGSDTLRQKIFIDKLKAGNYSITLIDKNKCKLESILSVLNPTPFTLMISPSLEIPLGDSFHLWVAPNHPLDTFFWSNRTIRTLDTFMKPFDSETYGITAIDKYGCTQTASTQVVIKRDNLFFAPQAFSPNGDKTNDYYQIYGSKTVVNIDNLKIFSRWGEMMYATDRIFPAASEQDGWDGRFRGREALPGVYIYIAEVIYIDGRKERIKGELMLAR